MKRIWHWIVILITVGLCLMVVIGLLLSLYLLWRMQALGDSAKELAQAAASRSLCVVRQLPK